MLEQFLRTTFSRIGGYRYFKAARLRQLQSKLDHFLSTGEQLTFTLQSRPVVTIIISVFNSACHTLQCLKSLISDQSVTFEVIVFDDGSSDQTELLLRQCCNIRVVRASVNLGYIKATNAAAGHAHGDFLLFLNNDARLVSGTLADCVNVFTEAENVGAVGVRIRQADGRLQEAGCVIYDDGITNGYMRFHHVEDPRVMFMREVDYCSGIFMMVRRQQFLDVGGFDEIYAPAYFEETDLCMKLRDKGLRVIYAPHILVEHFEFGSQTSQAGRKSIQLRRPVFKERWKFQLNNHGYRNSTWLLPGWRHALRLAPKRRMLLVTCNMSPAQLPARIRELLKTAIALGWHVTLAPDQPVESWSSFFQQIGKQVEVIPLASHRALKTLIRTRQDFYDLKLFASDKSSEHILSSTACMWKSGESFKFYDGSQYGIREFIKEPF